MLVLPGAVLQAQLIDKPVDAESYWVHGIVWISPTCAGAQKEGEPCRTPRADAKVQLEDENGRVAASSKTDTKGEFSLQAPAGNYRLQAIGLGKVMRCPHRPVTLPMSKPSPVNLECDSGMR